MKNAGLAASCMLVFACSGAPASDPAANPGATAGSGGDATGRGGDGVAGGGSAAPDAGAALDGAVGPGAPGVDHARAAAAATAAAARDPSCDAIATTGLPAGFYWEIGDANRVLASGSRGTYAEGTVRPVASATKMIAAAYLHERLASVDAAAERFLHFTSGYVAPIQTCPDDATVESCYAQLGGDSSYDAAKVDRFYYGPAHLQKLALGVSGMGAMTGATLAADVRRTLGLSSALAFKYPMLAGGMEAAPVTFREFLQKLLQGKYTYRDRLGKNPACTRGCAGETSTPIPDPWHYGAGHWIEDGCGQGTCDGAFSAIGAFGFYAWVDATKTYYGIVGHWELPRSIDGSMTSAFCGQKIRAAFVAATR